jgi:hypothetical protein
MALAEATREVLDDIQGIRCGSRHAAFFHRIWRWRSSRSRGRSWSAPMRLETLTKTSPLPYPLTTTPLSWAGWPREALLITLVRDRKDESHAVLTVKTDRGELILDNQAEHVLPWLETGTASSNANRRPTPMSGSCSAIPYRGRLPSLANVGRAVFVRFESDGFVKRAPSL